MWGLGLGCALLSKVRSKTNRVLEIIAHQLSLASPFEALVLVNRGRGIEKINCILSSMLEVEAAIEDHKSPKTNHILPTYTPNFSLLCW